MQRTIYYLWKYGKSQIRRKQYYIFGILERNFSSISSIRKWMSVLSISNWIFFNCTEDNGSRLISCYFSLWLKNFISSHRICILKGILFWQSCAYVTAVKKSFFLTLANVMVYHCNKKHLYFRLIFFILLMWDVEKQCKNNTF